MLPNEFFTFFRGLEKNNNKEWFDDNRKDYEKFVKVPFREFVLDTIEAIRTVEPELQQDAKDAIFRINRDIRFSKDKTPYKTHMSAHISRFGRKAIGSPGFFLQVSTKGGSLGGGCYQPDKEQLILIRDLIVHEGADLHKALKKKAFKDLYGELQGDKNKILPAEFKQAAESEPILYNKQFFYWATLPKSVFTNKNAVNELLKSYKAAKPVQDFFSRVFE
jgi:uncharacterized protein (TIGR02453 family)